MKKLIICLAVLTAAAYIFAGCAADNGGESNTVSNTSETVSDTQSTEPETATALDEDTGEAIPYVITEKQAQDAAYSRLKAQSEAGNYDSVDKYEFESIELKAESEEFMAYNAGYGNTSETENLTGHSYYAVSYFYTDSLADIVYFCVDAMTGDILFEGYMGD